eukprot:1176143-Prorocentrum_minimum.AAC.3
MNPVASVGGELSFNEAVLFPIADAVASAANADTKGACPFSLSLCPTITSGREAPPHLLFGVKIVTSRAQLERLVASLGDDIGSIVVARSTSLITCEHCLIDAVMRGEMGATVYSHTGSWIGTFYKVVARAPAPPTGVAFGTGCDYPWQKPPYGSGGLNQ